MMYLETDGKTDQLLVLIYEPFRQREIINALFGILMSYMIIKSAQHSFFKTDGFFNWNTNKTEEITRVFHDFLSNCHCTSITPLKLKRTNSRDLF